MNTHTLVDAHFLPSEHVESLSRIEAGYWWYCARVASARRLIGDWRGQNARAFRYVDVGCGTGGFARKISEYFSVSRLGLVDGDSVALRYAGQIKNAEVIQADFSQSLRLPFSPELITLMDVLEHVPDDGALLRNLHNNLETGGALVISVPAMPVLFSEWDRQLGHFRRYTRRDLAQKLEQAGFEVKRLFYKWSLLAPFALIRKFRTARYQSDMNFESTPEPLNTLLIRAGSFEDRIPNLFKPLGTSLMAFALKR